MKHVSRSARLEVRPGENSRHEDSGATRSDRAAGRTAFTFVQQRGWLADHLAHPIELPVLPCHEAIEEAAKKTNAAGGRSLWAGYKEIANYPRSTESTRTPNQVRIAPVTGRFFTWLASMRHSPLIVEIGTAFGISGMYWLAGIGEGHLYAFEPNQEWAQLAGENLASISSKFTLTADMFERSAPGLIEPASVDIAFIDAIHMPDVVQQQFAIVRPLMKPGGLVLFDDIGFSDGMRRCWAEIANSFNIAASGTLGRRTGIVELN